MNLRSLARHVSGTHETGVVGGRAEDDAIGPEGFTIGCHRVELVGVEVLKNGCEIKLAEEETHAARKDQFVDLGIEHEVPANRLGDGSGDCLEQPSGKRV